MSLSTLLRLPRLSGQQPLKSMKDKPHFVNPRDGSRYDIDEPRWRAPSGESLLVSDLVGIQRADIDSTKRSIWRYQAALPVKIEHPISLGEGCTPLIPGHYDSQPCRFKLEWFSPTGSFKDRGTSVMLSWLKQQGIKAICEDSSGNGGASVAAYGAAAGMAVTVLVPASTQPAKIAQIRAYGANVVLVPGPREATEAAAIQLASELFYASHNWHPFFLQGTKTIGYEIWEDLGFKAPHNIVIPGSAGSNLLGCHIAFRELLAAGEIEHLPRLFLSQPAHCAPVHASLQAGIDDFVAMDFKPTIAEGTAIKRPIRLQEMLQAIRETRGDTVAIEESEILKASFELARTGLYVEPTCAHAAAAFGKLLEANQISADEETIIILTGTGLKATAFYAEQFSE